MAMLGSWIGDFRAKTFTDFRHETPIDPENHIHCWESSASTSVCYPCWIGVASEEVFAEASNSGCKGPPVGWSPTVIGGSREEWSFQTGQWQWESSDRLAAISPAKGARAQNDALGPIVMELAPALHSWKPLSCGGVVVNFLNPTTTQQMY